MLKQLIVRADASNRIGTGHLMRCLALAQNLKTRGADVTFVTWCESETLRMRLVDEGMQVITLGQIHPHQLDWEITSQIIRKSTSAWVLLDGYQFDPKYQNQVKKTGHRLLVIDDTAHFSHYYADIVLNQGLGIDRLKYFHEPSTRLLLGSQYALLRSEFLIWRGWKREIPDVASKVLVTLGGSDRQNATLQVIKALKVVNRSDLQVKIVVGPSNPNIEILQDALYNSPCAMSILSSVSDMSKLMGWADLAITAAGSTCLELSFMQLPFAAIILAENQKYISEGVARAGIAISCGWYHELDTSSLASRINKLIEDRKSRSRMSKKASKIVDGFGADRAISAMEEYL